METRLRRNRRIGQPKHLPLELVRRILAPHANALFQMGDHGLCKFLLEQALTTHLQCHLGWACTTGRYALVRLMLRHGAFMDLAALMAVCNGNSILILRHIVETYQLPQQYLHAAISCCISSGSVGGLRYLVGRLTTLYHVRSAEAARIVVRSPDLGLLLSNGIVPGDTWMMYWAILLDSAIRNRRPADLQPGTSRPGCCIRDGLHIGQAAFSEEIEESGGGDRAEPWCPRCRVQVSRSRHARLPQRAKPHRSGGARQVPGGGTRDRSSGHRL